MRRESWAELEVVVTGGPDRQGGGDGPVLVLMHGFGATGQDLVPLWRILDVPESFRFVFPAAPLSLGAGYGGGRAWWLIDLLRLEQALASGDARDLTDDEPDGLQAAREQMTALL